MHHHNIYEDRQISTDDEIKGALTEQDKLIAGKQILIGLALLFALTEIIYMFNPDQGTVLLEICKTVFPPLATLIIAFYFKDKSK
jgi:hypothetical protein